MTPRVIEFEELGPCFWIPRGYRAPAPGEYFLSGARAYLSKAQFHEDTRYHIVTPSYYAVKGWVAGERVKT